MRYIFVVGALVALTGCVAGTGTLLYKPGVTVETKQADLDDCRIVAMKDVPSNMQTDYSPGYSSPGTVMCNTIGTMTTCNTVGAVNIPGSVSTYDANSPLRERIRNRCLTAKGYQLYEKPYCSTSEQVAYIKAHPNEVPSCIATTLK